MAEQQAAVSKVGVVVVVVGVAAEQVVLGVVAEQVVVVLEVDAQEVCTVAEVAAFFGAVQVLLLLVEVIPPTRIKITVMKRVPMMMDIKTQVALALASTTAAA